MTLEERLQLWRERDDDLVGDESNISCPSCDTSPCLVVCRTPQDPEIHLQCPECGHKEPARS